MLSLSGDSVTTCTAIVPTLMCYSIFCRCDSCMIPAKAMHLLKRCRENPYKVRTEADMKQVVRDMEKETLTGVKQRIKDLAFTHGVHNVRVSKLSCNSNLARLIDGL
jgi:hypothetical protein